jgi:hypothetical protein
MGYSFDLSFDEINEILGSNLTIINSSGLELISLESSVHSFPELFNPAVIISLTKVFRLDIF